MSAEANEELAGKFLEWIGREYESQREKLMRFCRNKLLDYSDDILGDTILKIHSKILSNGIADSSDKGFDNYLFMSFKTNTKREKQYAREMRRDHNATDEVDELYDKWCNTNSISAREKLLTDLWKDFSAIYLLTKVDENFDDETFYLVRMKFIEGWTYKQLAESGIEKSRQKVIDAVTWLKENVTKDEIKRALFERYGELIEFEAYLNY